MIGPKKKKKASFRERLKIKSEGGSVGKSAKDGKWYGWSHRAYFGFKTKTEARKFAESVAR